MAIATLMDVLTRALKKGPRPEEADPQTPAPETAATTRTFPMAVTDTNIVSCMQDQICHHCGAHDMLYDGPRGGICVNVMCGCCGEKVNFCIFTAQQIGVAETIRSKFIAEDMTIRNRFAEQSH